jgi:hypothetical protein
MADGQPPKAACRERSERPARRERSERRWAEGESEKTVDAARTAPEGRMQVADAVQQPCATEGASPT